ncbi:MAG: hypothetical protein R2705_01925 [Ilumatobacteraceae bacterium]
MNSDSADPGASTSSRAPWFVWGFRGLLAALLLVGAVYPLGPFEGKGMAYRLPGFLAPGLIVWGIQRRRLARNDVRPYPVALDLGLTVPFLSDTIGNALGLFDSVTHFDSVMHLLNWGILCWGITVALSRMPSATRAGTGLIVTAGAGIGALAIIAWEIMEYGVMKAGVAGLHLTYADTLGDLGLSATGGAIGAWIALRNRPPVPSDRPPDAAVQPGAAGVVRPR